MNTIKLNDKIIEYEISRNAKRNINIRIDSENKIKISAPRWVTISQINEVILEKKDWIIKNIEKQKSIKGNVLESGNEILYKGDKYNLYYKMADKNNVVVFDEYILVYSKHVDDVDYCKSVFQNWLKQNAMIEFKQVLDEYKDMMTKKYKIPNFTFQVKNMKTRWGSCTPSLKKISLSLNLMYTPHEYLEYVALHELSHFLEIHHNEHFYSIIEEFMPDYKIRQKTLNKEFSRIMR